MATVMGVAKGDDYSELLRTIGDDGFNDGGYLCEE